MKMAEKTLDELVEKTKDRIEDFLRTHISPNWMDIHDDIVIMYLFLNTSQDPNHKQSQHEINQVIEAMDRCNPILEYGEKKIAPIKPINNGYFFGMN
jgi:hypothetical protein